MTMTPPRKPSASSRDLVDYREMTEHLLQTESRILQHLNGFGSKVNDLDREWTANYTKLEERIRGAETKLSEGKGRSAAFGMFGGVIAAILTAILLRGLFPATSAQPNSLPASSAPPVAINLRIEQDPATGQLVAVPVRASDVPSRGGATSQPTPVPSSSASPSPAPSTPPSTLLTRLCHLLLDLCTPPSSIASSPSIACGWFLGRVPC